MTNLVGTYLLEHYLTLVDKKDMNKYRGTVWDLLSNAYSRIGGYKGATSPEHLVSKTDLWKLVRRNGKIDAVRVYRYSGGSRKTVGVGHDGTPQGKRDVVKIMKDDIAQSRGWGEFSGRAEELIKSFGGVAVPNHMVGELLGKEIISYNRDGYHYTRLIGGEPMEKILLGPEAFVLALDNTI